MSLVFKILPPAGKDFPGVGYNERKVEKGLAERLLYKGFSYLQLNNNAYPSDFKAYLKYHSSFNRRMQKPQFHAVLSCKGDTYTKDELKAFALKMMEEMGYKDNPTLIYLHSDTGNRHLHIITSRVDGEGNKINAYQEGIRANQHLKRLLHQNSIESGWRVYLPSQKVKFPQRETPVTQSHPSGYSLTGLIEETLYQVEQDSHEAGRRKRKRQHH